MNLQFGNMQVWCVTQYIYNYKYLNMFGWKHMFLFSCENDNLFCDVWKKQQKNILFHKNQHSQLQGRWGTGETNYASIVIKNVSLPENVQV